MYTTEISTYNIASTAFFLIAVFHVFCTPYLHRYAEGYKKKHFGTHSISTQVKLCERCWYAFLKLIGEVELIFGIWLIPTLAWGTLQYGWSALSRGFENVLFEEALYLGCVMAIASSGPFIAFVEACFRRFSTYTHGDASAWWWMCMIFGPLVGVFTKDLIGMLVTTSLLISHVFHPPIHPRVIYVTLATLFVNISISSMMKTTASSAILLFCESWGWTQADLNAHFVVRASTAILCVSLVGYSLIHKMLRKSTPSQKKKKSIESRKNNVLVISMGALYALLLVWMSVLSAYPIVYGALTMLFFGVHHSIFGNHHDIDIFRSVLISFFVGSLVLHAQFQSWWVEPVIASMPLLFPPHLLALLVSALVDKTVIASMAPYISALSEQVKYSLALGTFVGGGLTLFASAANITAYVAVISRLRFEVSLVTLSLWAVIPTAVAYAIFFFV